jgi:hypothetical protein
VRKARSVKRPKATRGAKARRAPSQNRARKVASPPRRGPGRWLDDDALFLYPEGYGSDAGAGAAWHDAYREFRRRKRAALDASAMPTAAGLGPDVAAPAVPGGVNWLSLGPSVVMNGQTGGGERQPVAGRVAGLAVGMGGTVIFAASANGGVFRSRDGALTWDSVDELDFDPESPASASLICGAIAMNPANPKRIFVGTGEGATYTYFSRRVTGALPAYRGIGILRSDDGGANWIVEPSDLAGQAFFSIALDPTDPERAVAATTSGLYCRRPQAGGQFEWVRIASGVYSSVVSAAAAGAVRFFAALWPQDGDGRQADVVTSSDTEVWEPAGTGFPIDDVRRISLAVQPGNLNLVYAVAADDRGRLRGLFRLHGLGQAWKAVSALPNVLPPDANGNSQGNYDLAIAVDPERGDIVYLGGNNNVQFGGASIWRCELESGDGNVRVANSATIGQHAHSDVHVLVHSPGNPNELWCGCDGGVFLNRDPRGTGKFTAQNNGLSCLCCNFIAQHPTDPSIIFTGLQDNGTALKAGSFWHHVQDGDGGYCVINWADPSQVLVFCNGRIYRSTTGGTTHESWPKFVNLGWQTMTQPIVGVTFNSDAAFAADANRVATGVGSRVWISDDFGASWPGFSTNPPIALSSGAGAVFALAFGSRTRLYIGTTLGKVFRADETDGRWSMQQLEGGPAKRLGVSGVVTDVAVDWADATLNSLYVAFGSLSTPSSAGPRVWWFDGQDWEARSGTAPANLLNVEHNALAVDRRSPNHVYVGADIGVWHSADGGRNWEPFQNGLPDAPVFDLQIHPTQRLLRAATHGRGIYEIPI